MKACASFQMIDNFPYEVLLLIIRLLDFHSAAVLYRALPKGIQLQLDESQNFFRNIFKKRVARLEARLPLEVRCSVIPSLKRKEISDLADLWHKVCHLEPYEMVLGFGPLKTFSDDEKAFLTDAFYMPRSSLYSLNSVPYKTHGVRYIGYVSPKNPFVRNDLKGAFVLSLTNCCVQIVKWCKMQNRMAVLYSFSLEETVDKMAISRSVTGVMCFHLEKSKNILLLDLGRESLILRRVGCKHGQRDHDGTDGKGPENERRV